MPKDQAATEHEALVKKIFNEESEQLVLYSDGSQMQLEGGADDRGIVAGGGWCLFSKETVVSEASIGLGAFVEVYDAEAIALQAGVEVAIATAKVRGVRHIWAFVDNQAIVAASLTDSLSTSPATFRKLQDQVKAWLETDSGNVFHLHWVPAHFEIEGKEHADKLAKMGCYEQSPRDEHTCSHAKRLVRERNLGAWRDQAELATTVMRNATPRSAYSYGDTDIASFSAPVTLNWPRKYLAALLQAKTGHGDFADYHARFGAPERANDAMQPPRHACTFSSARCFAPFSIACSSTQKANVLRRKLY